MKICDSLNPQEQDAETLKSKLDNLRQAEKARLRKIDTYKEKIIQYQKEADTPPKVEDIQDINDELVWFSNDHEEFEH